MIRNVVVAILGIAFVGGDLLAEPKFSQIEGPRVSIEKKCPPKRFVGTAVKYDITVANEGDSMALDVVITDKICETAEFLTASEGGELKEGHVVWNLGNLPPGESVTVTSRVKGTVIGAELNCPARVEWRAIAAVEDKCKTVIGGIPALLLEVVDINDPVLLGDVETYEITVTNQGSLDGRDIVVKATLPDQLQYVSAEGPTEPSATGQIVTFGALPTLAPKAKAVYTLKAKTVGVGDIRFRLDLTSLQSPEPIFETESTNIFD